MLVWNESKEDDKSNDENVLDGLQPHRNLKILEIKGFKGNNFPLWTLRMEVREDPKDHWIRLDNLLEVQLSDCKECEEIPMLGHLPRLKSLYLRRLFNVKSIGSSFYGIKDDEGNKETSMVFPALEKLELIDMKNLTSWIEVDFSCTSQPHEEFIFRRLEHLRITDCRQLKSVPSHFPCLKELVIDNMESGLPLASICGSQLTTLSLHRVDRLVCLPNELFNKNRDLVDLHIRYCNNLLYPIPRLGGSGTSLRRLMIYKCQNLKELSEEVHKLNALEELIIWDCPNLKKLISPQGFTSSLRHLFFLECSGLINFPCEMLESCVLSLETLKINGLESLTNLEQVMSILQKMPRLTLLDIRGVPILPNVVVETGSLCNIAKLDIGGCGDFVSMGSVNRIFPAFQSLRELTLYGMEEWNSLPDQLQHLTTLQKLSLWEFGIQMLPEWLEMLSSLTTLGLWSCKQLRHLPSKKAMQGLANLTYLCINECPLLKQDLELEASDDSEWSKLSHIPLIRVDGLTKFELQLNIRLGKIR